MEAADDLVQQSRRERALAWYAIHADEMIDTWLNELWPLSPNIESKSRFRRRLTELRDVFFHAISADAPNASFERSQGVVFSKVFAGDMNVLTATRMIITRTMLTELPLPFLPAVTQPFEQAMTRFIWGYCDHATAIERLKEDEAVSTAEPESDLDPAWYRELVNRHPVAITISRASDHVIVAGNPAVERLFGYTVAELSDLPDDAVIVDSSPENEADKVHELAIGKIPDLVRERVLRHKDGHPVRFQSRHWNLFDAAGKRKYIATEDRLLDDQETLWQRAEKRFRYLTQFSVDPAFVIDRAGRISYASPATLRGLGSDPDALVGRAFMELVLLDDHKAFTEFRRALEESPRALRSIELRLYRNDGQWRWFEITGSNLFDVPEIEGISLQARDITDRKRVEEWLSQQALIDPLTNLLNRRGMMAQLELALERSQKSGGIVGVLFIDLDRFRVINRRYGHETGDALLVEIGERLRFLLGGASSAARLGGDEFVVLLEKMSPEQITALADQIAAALGNPIEVGASVHRVGANIGIVTGKGGRDDAMQLLRAADAAQYGAKAAGDGLPMFHTDVEA